MRNSQKEKINPRVKDILKLLGLGTILIAAVVMPGLPAVLLKEYNRAKIENDKKKWEKFDLWRLHQIIRRLQKQKVVEIKNGIVQITEKGKQRVLKFNIDDMELKEKTDGKWRFIIYDIANLRKPQREQFRAILKRLKFLRIQKSVYLTPFVCDEEIEYLRQIFNIGDEVIVLKVSSFEKDNVYRSYFGL